ncbi:MULTISPECIES: AMP-binding protein [unclassified Mesorhizobium]|uniref:AMP-binding protein n=1 Tax=unclassified Mesorhizobium TaxID=325217 RepID=UPI003335D93D
MVDLILSRIRNHMVRSPQTPALVGETGVMRFGELGRRCAGIAAHLQDLPPGPLLVVGHKDHDCIAAMLACAFAGRPFIFVDRMNPVQRIERIAAIAGVTHALVASSGIALSTVTLLDARDMEALPVEAVPSGPVPGSTLFYLVFTSGSTGVPKGVAVTRDNFAAFDDWYGPLRHAHAGRGAHVNHASLAFDMGMLDLWPALATGTPVILLDHRNNVIARNNMRLMSENGVTTPASWFSTPSLLQIMRTDKGFCGKTFPELKCFFVGGEVVQKNLIRDLWRCFPEAVVLHAYGPTEVTCVTHAKALKPADLEIGDLLPLGPALATTTMRIVKPEGSLAAAGELGEVVLSGPQVAVGYLPPDHPRNVAFATWRGEPSYRTGDLGYVDQFGDLVLLGRIDRQVKWNGNRIELDEIEGVACALPYVVQASCVPIFKDGRVINIVLFLQLAADRDIPRDTIVLDMRQALPAVMVPRDIHLVSTFQLTINGKIDTAALRAIAGAEASQSAAGAGLSHQDGPDASTPFHQRHNGSDLKQKGVPQ